MAVEDISIERRNILLGCFKMLHCIFIFCKFFTLLFSYRLHNNINMGLHSNYTGKHKTIFKTAQS